MQLFVFVFLVCLLKSAYNNENPCDNAVILDDDWRLPSEDDVSKCDSQLEAVTWYKFQHQHLPAIIAQGPIPEKHCGTTGSISLSFKSPNQQYPPLTNQSAIFVFCVHVSIMGLITCIDHLTISVVAMTCANNEVVYYWQEPIKTCPSAFCVIAPHDKIDDFYILKPREPENFVEYRHLKVNHEKHIFVADLTRHHLNIISTLEFKRNNESNKDLDSIQSNLKLMLWETQNENEWLFEPCVEANEHSSLYHCSDPTSHANANLKDTNHINHTNNELKNNSDDNTTHKTRTSTTSQLLRHPRILDNNQDASTQTSQINSKLNSRNKRNLNQNKFLSNSFSQELCDIKVDHIQSVSLRPHFYQSRYRVSFFVENFCGYVSSSALVAALEYLNFTSRLENLNGIQDIHAIYTRLPKDQEPLEFLLSLSLSASVWVIIFCSLFIMISLSVFVLLCFRLKLKFGFVDQKEKIFLVDCEQTHKWVVLSSGVKNSRPIRSRLNTTTSRSTLGTFSKRRKPSSVSSSKLSPTETIKSTQKHNFASISKNESLKYKNDSIISENKKSFLHSPSSCSNLIPPRFHITSSGFDSDTDHNSSDKTGWIVPLDEFEKSILSGTISFPVPKMVVDKKRRSRRHRNKKGHQDEFASDIVNEESFNENDQI